MIGKPMLATLTEERFSDDAWIFERKLDGVRAICSRDGAQRDPVLWSRNQNVISESYPEILRALRHHGGARFVADGELVAFDGHQTSFAKLRQRIHLTDPRRIEATGVQVFYYLFDLVALDGSDLTGRPLLERKHRLATAFDFVDPLRLSTHRVGDGEEFYRVACSRGWEGLVAKRADSRYMEGRSRDWLKMKCVLEQEFVIGGFTDPAGSRAGFGALLVGYHERGRFRYAGKVGTGYDQRTLRRMRDQLDGLEQRRSPFHDPVSEPGSHWVRPETVVQVRFSEWTGDGKLRHPRFLGVRTDKSASEVTREG